MTVVTNWSQTVTNRHTNLALLCCFRFVTVTHMEIIIKLNPAWMRFSMVISMKMLIEALWKDLTWELTVLWLQDHPIPPSNQTQWSDEFVNDLRLQTWS